MKYSFKNDYSEMAHPKILKALSAVGNRQFEGYGLDDYTSNATILLKKTFKVPNADIHFISGATHANLVVISSALRPHEAVIAPESGHIFVHEAGSIEATGHKICTRPGYNGKLSVGDIESIMLEHSDEHMVKPRLVYISLSTECGTVYTKAELSTISKYCKSNSLYLYIDGARLSVAINSPACDLSYIDIAELADAFILGGTKGGALFGEVIVIVNDKLKEDFRFLLKQRGGLLAKTAAISVQFNSLLTDGLLDELAIHSINMAKKLSDGIVSLGYEFMYPVETNLIIPIFPVEIVEKMRQSYSFYDWKGLGNKTAVRLLTSWATPENMVDEFIANLRLMGGH